MKKPKKIIDHPDFEIYWPMPVTWKGFLVAWGFVIGLVVLTMLFFNIGA